MSSDSPRIAIVGGGFLGSALAQALGGPCIVTTRSGAWTEGAPPDGVQVVALDITAPHLDASVLQRAQSLVIAVAPGGVQDRRLLYVEGTRRLLEGVGASPWRRVVYISSTSAYPDVDGWIDESAQARPMTERGQLQRDAEDVVARWAVAHGVPWLCLRLGGLYGPGRELGRLYRERREGPLPGSGNTPTNLIHLDDAVQATMRALDAPGDLVGPLGVVDDDHRTRRVMYEDAARRRGEAAPQWEGEVPAGQPPHGKRVSNVRMKLELGVRLQHPSHVPSPNG